MKLKYEILVKIDGDNQIPGSKVPSKQWFLDPQEGDGDHSYEISVIKISNKHGHTSWGWDEFPNKSILFSDSHNCISPLTKKNWEKALEAAQSFCDTLNK